MLIFDSLVSNFAHWVWFLKIIEYFFLRRCIHIVLRLYPDLTRECRRQKCLPEFTYDDSFLTETP